MFQNNGYIYTASSFYKSSLLKNSFCFQPRILYGQDKFKFNEYYQLQSKINHLLLANIQNNYLITGWI